MNIDRLLEKNYEKYIGAFGFATAAHAVSENQEGGALHMHGHIHGTWDIDVIQNWVHKDDFRKRMIDLLDSVVNYSRRDQDCTKTQSISSVSIRALPECK